MGFSISWFGFRGYEIKDAAALFGRDVGDSSEDFDAPISAYLSNKNWAIIILDYCSFPNPPDSYLSVFSQGREMVVVHVEEHQMFARAEFWSNGKNIWRVWHSGDKNIRDFHTTGDPPASFESLRQQAFSKQDKESNVDHVFDIPLDLAAELTGFRHDEGAPDRVFFELVKRPAQK
ncbi:hypothetical protein EN828_07025 [Mesorhizobium sp. M2D.F.Ca.ET.185.01.1.1]|uniref:hypothetical protein n=1 Tax=unclassified Mesorhizobium TaxID=325217 RepID=UPI000FCA258E|nr:MULTISPECIES: hypothetical protein [unclassified Mesorhizobium]TGP57090.1 hypothetical protein EN873_03045 [bacterium M00.F.Ca.ET.230.01.1.1]TGP76436.1 hypothetical protein EN870_22825 [bacterium M00.F.Ca.ET.227.01.1.1]TGP92487.1 hypothetical protein EN865_21260 [bacterium M00.F.Ca.ET.222.01.1.1]TGP97042.1 hypothetical protein EN864_11540 [bacterium M00.F.Ca.ET.221.01.1.1]TGT68536.1 hypothetical protein EN802_26950 [bacterium M00.F.Ca.ET.159.01.1.1]TGT80370.1 hypothetical protein EN800_262